MKVYGKQLALFLVVALFGIAGLQGCGDDDPVDPDPDPTTDTTTASLLVVHGAAGGPAVDIVVDTTVLTSNLTFGESTDGYLEVNDGSRRIRITPVGNLAGALVDGTVTLTEDEHYTAFASIDTAGEPGMLVFEDDLSAPAAGKAHVRLVHLIPDGPHARLGIPNSGTGPLHDSVSFMEQNNVFAAVNAGAVTFSVANADGGGGSGSIPRLVPNFTTTLEDGGIYTIVLIGKIGDSTARHLIIEHSHGH